MTKKTGRMALKARQLARAAKLAKYKQMIAESGEELSLPKPSAEARRQKEQELKELYLELISKKKQPQAESEKSSE